MIVFIIIGFAILIIVHLSTIDIEKWNPKQILNQYYVYIIL